MKQIIYLYTFVIAIFSLQSCGEEPKPTVTASDLSFHATNLSIDNGKLTATSGTTIFLEWSVSVNINGETTVLNGSSKSDELPVRQGDEVEIRFIPSCSENTEANFIFPDGISVTLNVSNPTFKWVVPDNFSDGMLIRGETHYETEDAIYNLSGEITLKSIVI